MAAATGESTQDWLLPEHSRPPLCGVLVGRVAPAPARARAAAAAAVAVGAGAIGAAEQAERAANLAEKASATALEAQDRVATMALAPAPAPSSPAEPGGDEEDDSLSDFSARADRLVARLRQLQRVPLGSPATSDVSSRTQSSR